MRAACAEGPSPRRGPHQTAFSLPRERLKHECTYRVELGKRTHHTLVQERNTSNETGEASAAHPAPSRPSSSSLHGLRGRNATESVAAAEQHLHARGRHSNSTGPVTAPCHIRNHTRHLRKTSSTASPTPQRPADSAPTSAREGTAPNARTPALGTAVPPQPVTPYLLASCTFPAFSTPTPSPLPHSLPAPPRTPARPPQRRAGCVPQARGGGGGGGRLYTPAAPLSAATRRTSSLTAAARPPTSPPTSPTARRSHQEGNHRGGS